MTHDSWKDAAHDAHLTNMDLRDRIKELEGELTETKRKLSIEHMNLVFANDKLRNAGMSTEPYYVDDGEFECGECSAQLKEHWWACPGCGKRIDWDARRYPEESGWYAEEGERFLQAEVYGPIGEAMRA